MTAKGAQLVLFIFCMLSQKAWATTAPPKNDACTCYCTDKCGRCLDKSCDGKTHDARAEATPNNFRDPKESIALGLSILKGTDPDKLVIRRNEIFLRYEHQFLPGFYVYVVMKTELTYLTYYKHFKLSDKEANNAGLPISEIDLQAGLTSRWNRITGAGLHLVPYKSDRFMLHVSSGFEEMAQTEATIQDVYFLTPLLSLDTTDIAQEHVRVLYDWKKADVDVRFDWTLPWRNGALTPYVRSGLMIAKSNIEISYDEEIAKLINEVTVQTGIRPNISRNEEFYLLSPSLGVGAEIHLAGPLGLDVAGSALPFGQRKMYIGTIGIVLRK